MWFYVHFILIILTTEGIFFKLENHFFYFRPTKDIWKTHSWCPFLLQTNQSKQNCFKRFYLVTNGPDQYVLYFVFVVQYFSFYLHNLIVNYCLHFMKSLIKKSELFRTVKTKKVNAYNFFNSSRSKSDTRKRYTEWHFHQIYWFFKNIEYIPFSTILIIF